MSKWAMLLAALIGSAAGCERGGGQRDTYHQDVEPIVMRQCAACHRPGGSAPFSLLTYQDVSKHAADIVKVTRSRFMPPWLPEHGYGEFAEERRLSDGEIETIGRWVKGGRAEGKPAATPPPQWKDGWQLGEPDLVAQMPSQYTLPGEGRDVYRNFVVPLALSSSKWVRAVEFQAGNKRVIHHAFVLFDTSGTARRLDGADGEVGYAGMDAGEDVGVPTGHNLSWQPGKRPSLENPQRDWRLPKGADMVLQMHMRPDGKPEEVGASVGFYFTEKAPTQFPYVLLLKSAEIDIPAGQKDWVVESSYILPVDVEAVSILPHAHYLGKQLEGGATLPDGSNKPLILIRNWNFDWQGDYQYAKPVALPKGSRLWMRFHFDNSEANVRNPNHPPKRVRYGLQSSDEMAELWIQVVPKSYQDLVALVQDYQKSYSIPDQITHYRNVLREFPEDAGARAKLGADLAGSGALAEGSVELKRAIELDGNNAKTHFNLGAALAQQGKIVDAVAEYESVLRIDPGYFRAYNNLGTIYYNQGKFDLAARQFYKALNINPNDILVNTNLARLFLSERNWGQAKVQLETLLSIDPENAFARQALKGVTER